MNDEQLELARRLVKCEQWRYLEVMTVKRHDGYYVVIDAEYRAEDPPYAAASALQLHEGEDIEVVEGWELFGLPSKNGLVLPDLSDYVTASALLRLAIEFHWVARLRAPTPIHDAPRWSIGEAWMDPDLGTAAARALLAIWEPSS